MVIDPKRIEAGLSPSGFRLAYLCDVTHAVVFYRPYVSDLFEIIRIGQGRERGKKWGHIVNIGVDCSLVPGRTAVKGMIEVRSLMELTTEGERGWKVFHSVADAREWEEAVARVAPMRACELAAEVGPDLLERTAEQRHALKRYGELIGFGGEVSVVVQDLKSRISERQRVEVDRILKCWIVMIPDGRIFYELATLTIAACAAEVKGNPEWFFGIDPANAADRSLMIELQLLASRFANEPGWE